MNVEAIWKAVEYLEQEPRRFVMEDGICTWATLKQRSLGHDWLFWQYATPDVIFDEPPCGTVSCMAGAVLLSQCETEKIYKEKLASNNSIGWIEVEMDARSVLNLTVEQADRLFYLPGMDSETGEFWPPEFASQYKHAKFPEERVAVLRQRVQRFVDTGGAE